MNRRTIIIGILALIVLTVLGLWFMSRKNAQDAGREPLGFRDFFGLGDKTVQNPTPIDDGLSSDFTNGTTSGTNSSGTDTIPTTVSTFTGDSYSPDSGETSTDLCPNIGGIQTTVPDDRILDESGNCTPITNGDLCLNITGIQRTVPNGKIRDISGECTDVANGDMCLNITGIQTTVPSGMTRNAQGDCLASFMDLCPNIDGDQYELPPNMTFAANGQCVPQTEGGIAGCSDEDVRIPFTQAEQNQLRDLENRFYKISSTLYTDADADVERSNYSIYKTKVAAITELRTYCETYAPNLADKALLARVPTPYWRSKDSAAANKAPQEAPGAWRVGTINQFGGSALSWNFVTGQMRSFLAGTGYAGRAVNAINSRNVSEIDGTWYDIRQDEWQDSKGQLLSQTRSGILGWNMLQMTRSMILHQSTDVTMDVRYKNEDSITFATYGNNLKLNNKLYIYTNEMEFINHLQRILRLVLW